MIRPFTPFPSMETACCLCPHLRILCVLTATNVGGECCLYVVVVVVVVVVVAVELTAANNGGETAWCLMFVMFRRCFVIGRGFGRFAVVVVVKPKFFGQCVWCTPSTTDNETTCWALVLVVVVCAGFNTFLRAGVRELFACRCRCSQLTQHRL